MREHRLKVSIRTPRELLWEDEVSSLRVPCVSGQVGVRPRTEAMVLAVEPGLILARLNRTTRWFGTAGGLLRCDGQHASILTPLAVTGENPETILNVLDTALNQPDAELEVRRLIERLQSDLLREHGQKETSGVGVRENDYA